MGEVEACEPRCLIHPPEIARQGNPALRPDLGLLLRVPPRPVPPPLVSFDELSDTMDRSNSRLRLGALLRLSLAWRPHRRPSDGPDRVSWVPKIAVEPWC